MRLLVLGLLELVLGVFWGFVWSVYSKSLVDSGFNGFSYGLLGLAMSIATFTAYFAGSLAYYTRLGGFVMPISALCLGLSYYMLYNRSFIELTPITIGLALGGHTVSTIRTSSQLTSGNPRLMAFIYSLSLIGFSLGALAVAIGYHLNPLYVLPLSLVAGLTYRGVQEGLYGGGKPQFYRGLFYAMRSSLWFIVTSLILGVAGGLTLYNIDYYIVSVYNAGEYEVALMLASSGLLAILASTTLTHLVKSDWSTYAKLILAQALIIAILPLVRDVGGVIAVYVGGKTISVIADAVFDSMYTRAPPLHLVEFRIPVILASWELSQGLGKMIGSELLHVDPTTTIVIGSMLMIVYGILALTLGDRKNTGKPAFTMTPEITMEDIKGIRGAIRQVAIKNRSLSSTLLLIRRLRGKPQRFKV